MGYEERSRRRKKKRSIQRFIIIFIFMYFLISSTTSVFSFNQKTQLAESYTWNEKIETKGIIIKDEKIVEIRDKEENERYVEEGDRVSVGQEIIKLKNRNTSHLQEELKSLDEDILALEQIQNKGQDKDNHNAEDQPESLSGKSLENLREKREGLIKDINSASPVSKAHVSGIVSYELDGLEGTLLPQNFENYTYNKMDKLEGIEDEEDSKLNGYKIIDNLRWFLALKVEDKSKIKDYDINKFITVEILELPMELSGRIIEINESKAGSVMIISLNKGIHDFYNLRFSDVNIIKNKVDAFKIPSDSIISYKEQEGVIVKGFNDLYRFKPVKILSKEKKHTIVDKGKENGYIKLNNSDKEYRTITKYDEIIIKPSKIKQKEIID